MIKSTEFPLNFSVGTTLVNQQNENINQEATKFLLHADLSKAVIVFKM